MSAIPAWLNVPDAESWRTLLSIKSSHRSLFRVTRNAPQCIAPAMHGDRGIWSDDPRLHRLLADLDEQVSAIAKPNIDSDGFASPNAIISDFHSIRNVSGWYMDPITIPMMSNRILGDTLDLATGFLSERDEKIFHALHSYMFRTVVPASMGIRKTASSGAPYFTAELGEKKKALAVFNEYSGDILSRFGQGQLRGLCDDYGLFFATYMGVRTQPDGCRMVDGRLVPKAREVNDELYARTGGREGRRFDADKRVFLAPGVEAKGVFANRRRSVYAYPAMYNYWITQFFTPLRAFYLHDAEFTYKHRDPESIAAKLREFESVRGFDVKQFDQSIQPWLIDAFVDGFGGFLREEVLFFLRHVLKQPIYVPHPMVANASGEDRPLFGFNPCFGDPWDLKSFNLEVGLPSGIGPNPDMGKFFMTFVYLALLDRHFGDVLEVGIPTILKGKHTRYALLDMGDDAVLASNDPSLWKTIEAVIGGKFYVKVEPENGISFLGNVLFKDHRNELRATANMVTFLRNRLCPEHGCQHWSRRDFVGSGWFEGKKHYSTAPMFGEIYGLWDDLWHKHFGESLDVRFNVARMEERHRGVPTLSEADRAVFENPDKLYYRYDIEEIHEWVRDKLVGSVAFEDYFPSIERYFI